MKARLLALFVDLLLDCFSLLIGPDKSPGIAVSTIPELAAALTGEDSGSSSPLLRENATAIWTQRTILPSTPWRRRRDRRLKQAAARRLLTTGSRGLE